MKGKIRTKSTLVKHDAVGCEQSLDDAFLEAIMTEEDRDDLDGFDQYCASENDEGDQYGLGFEIESSLVREEEGDVGDEQTNVEHEAKNASAEAKSRNVGGPSLLQENIEGDESVSFSTAVFVRTSLATVCGDRSQQRIAASILSSGAEQQRCGATSVPAFQHVRPSSAFASDSEADWFEKAFPYLFPFGRGGPSEHRTTCVSTESCLQHYLRLSTRQFQGFEFVLSAYNVVARKKTLKSAYVSCNLQPVRDHTVADNAVDSRVAACYSSISAEDLKAAAEYRKKCGHAAAIGAPIPTCPSAVSNNAKRFFQSVSACAKAAPHTAEATKAARCKAYAMHYSFGKPTFWITISPDDMCSIIIHWIAMGKEHCSVPERSIRVKLLSEAPGAAALNFERILFIVISILLNWDIVNCGPRNEGGLFGITKAWSYCVEEQGRMSLHMHIARLDTRSLRFVGAYSRTN